MASGAPGALPHDGLGAEIEAARLTEQRRAAVAERADRMLSLGRFDELVVDPEPFVRADALHERFAVLLMTALFNAGRQSDALAVYQRASGAPEGAGRASLP